MNKKCSEVMSCRLEKSAAAKKEQKKNLVSWASGLKKTS